MRYTTPLRLFRLSSFRPSGGSVKPKWTIPKEQMWHPQIPDRQYYGEHATYNGFVLWLRAMRPYLEKIIGDTFNTTMRIASSAYSPVTQFVKKHNPDLKSQIVALASFAATSACITSYFGNYYQRMVDISNLIELGVAQELEAHGFWKSHSEDTGKRLQDYAVDANRLNDLWQDAITDASTARSFETLTKYLEVNETELPEGVPPPISWRFNMLPYGKDNADTQTFPTPSYEQPMRAVALSFTYNNLMGNWGDHIERTDNKGSALRPARMLFADVYIPGTK